MKSSALKSAILLMLLFLVASIAGAATLTVGPAGTYSTPCPAIKAAASGDTITIDYNGGIPYTEPADPTRGNRSDCVWFTDNLTIVGINGRPILDAAGEIIEKGIFNPYGANNVISNLEFRNAATQPGQGSNGAGVRVDSGSNTAPAGGNITIQFCYFHNNEDGILTANVGPGTGGQYEFTNPYITLLNNEFAFNGQNGDGHTHNMYIGYDGGNTEIFNLKYSWTHDAFLGHTVKSRAPINNVEYNLITDQWGATSYMLNFPLGGTTYVVGNSLYKSQTTNGSANRGFMLWRDVGDNTPTDPEYGLPLEDLHFVNNTVVLDSSNNTAAYVVVSCGNSDASTCSAPGNGPVLSVNAVVENNIFVGPTSTVVNQTTAVANHNLVQSNTPANLAALFVDWAHFNFHLVSGAPAIGAGVYPPTNNAGSSDPNALAVAEYVQPMSYVARPTPTGSTMDEGAYSYPRADTPPSPTLSYTTSVTTPGTGTITLSGLPTPPTGKYNNAVFISSNTAVIPAISSASSTTSTVVGKFTTCCATGTTSVPIDIYVDGAHLTATVSVVPGSVALQSITLDRTYYPGTTVHLTNASSSPVVVSLTTTDASILAVPSSVTIPAGQLSAETGSETGSLWGQTPSTKTATISATYAGVTQTLPVVVYPPHVNHFYCSAYDPGCEVVGGNTVPFIVGIAGDFPAGGGPVTFTSDTPSVIPNQTFTGPAGNFYSTFNLTTNTVTASKNVTISISVNGSTKTPLQVVTVTPATGTGIAVYSGNGQSSPVGTSFPSPLAVYVSNNGSALSGATVTFSGSGVSFPGGATAVTNSSGVAQVTATPTAAGSLTVNATVSGASGPAVFSETGGSGTAASVAVVSGSGQSSPVGTNFTNPLVVVVKDASNNPVSGATVTYAGTGVSFPSGATAVTNGSGQASVTAQPTTTGALTVTASVAGVGTPASFSETGTASGGGSFLINSDFATTPPMTPGQGIYTYNPTNVSGWTFSVHTGVAENGSAWGFTTPTDGANQVAFLQNTGTVTQTISGMTTGQLYTVSFYLEGRPGFTANPVTVTVGGTTLVTTTPGSGWTLYSQTFTATATSETLSFSTSGDPAGDIDSGLSDVTVTTSAPLLTNPDFATTPPMTPGAGTYIYNPTNVSGWTFSTGSGVAENGSAWGFTPATDGANQVAFLQNTATVTQTISGMTIGQQYKVSYYLEARPCCTPNPITITVGGATLFTTTPGSGWTLYSQTFTATATSELLSFSTNTTSGDNDTGLSDVTVTASHVTNSDFATTPPMTPGAGTYIYDPTNVSGWTFSGATQNASTGSYGSGVAENGSAWGFTTPTDGANQVAFLQDTSTVTQTISGLTVGQLYTLSFYLEARPCCASNPITATVGGATLLTTTPVSGWTLYSQTFTATATSELLSFSTSTPSGDVDAGLSGVTVTP